MKYQANENIDTYILIVDDDEAIRDSMNEFLEISGYKSYNAANAKEAIELLEKHSFHVVITDIMMPGMNGLELTDLIKKDYNANVIVMTGFSGRFSYENAIHKGASDFVSKPVRFAELILRIKRVLRERQSEQERAMMMKELEMLAITDDLTQLYNARHFYRQLELEIDRAVRYNHPLALILLDIDFFKDFNDKYGHLHGDKILVKLGEIIMSCLRKMDSAYRYGGEEFTIILPQTNANEATSVAYRLGEAIRTEKSFGITISSGVTEYFPREDLKVFVQRSDQAMYLSKANGRNKVTALLAGGDKHLDPKK